METRPADSRAGAAPARRDDGITAVSSVAYGFMGCPRNAALWFFANLAISATTHPHTVGEITRAMSGAGFVEVTARPHIPDITFAFTGRRA